MEAMQLLMGKRRSSVGDVPEIRYSLEELKSNAYVDRFPSTTIQAIFRGSRPRRISGVGQKSRRSSEGDRPRVLHSLESLKRDLCADVIYEEQRRAEAAPAPAPTSAFTSQADEELDPDFSLVSLQEVRQLLRAELQPILREVQRGEAVRILAMSPNGVARPRQSCGQAGQGTVTRAIQAALRDEIAAGLEELRGGAVQEEAEAAEPRCPTGHVSDADGDGTESSDSWGDDSDDDLPPEAKRKLIICVRSDIKMSIGKTAAQVGHAVHSAVRRSTCGDIQAWEACGAKKVTLRVDSQDELLEIRRAARAAGLIAESIRDAGHTELEPGTMTVLAIGPAQEASIDPLTGHLRPLPDTLLRENEKLKAQNAKLQSELDSVRKEKKGLRQDKLRLLKLMSVKDRYV